MSKAIKDLLPKVLQQASKQHEAISQVQSRWSTLVGRDLARHSKPVTIRRGILTVQADQPAVNFALTMKKPTLLKKLGELPGSQIRELVIRAGSVA